MHCRALILINLAILNMAWQKLRQKSFSCIGIYFVCFILVVFVNVGWGCKVIFGSVIQKWDDDILNGPILCWLKTVLLLVYKELIFYFVFRPSTGIPVLHSGSHFRHGLLQLIIHTINPLHDGSCSCIHR